MLSKHHEFYQLKETRLSITIDMNSTLNGFLSFQTADKLLRVAAGLANCCGFPLLRSWARVIAGEEEDWGDEWEGGSLHKPSQPSCVGNQRVLRISSPKHRCPPQ